jgi:hypothetical protein
MNEKIANKEQYIKTISEVKSRINSILEFNKKQVGSIKSSKINVYEPIVYPLENAINSYAPKLSLSMVFKTRK